MRGVYRANIKASGLNSGRTVVYITAPSTRVVEILSAKIGNESNTTNQQLSAAFQKISSLGTPTGTTLTPTKAEQGDQAAGSTVVGNVTASEPSYASNTQFDLQGFASLAGYQHAPVPEERLYIAASDSWGLRLLTTSPTAFDCDIELVFREIG
jgi:hypothetical protein